MKIIEADIYKLPLEDQITYKEEEKKSKLIFKSCIFYNVYSTIQHTKKFISCTKL